MKKFEKTIAVIGGTGALGSALACRWLLAGHNIVIGSRSQEKAEHAAMRMASKVGRTRINGYANKEAATLAEIVVLAVPYAAHQETLEEIVESVAGKLVIETTVPLQPPRVARAALPKRGSVGAVTQDFLGESVRVVSALHTVSASHLGDVNHELNGDVLVYGNHKASRQVAIELIKDVGLKAWHAGSIENSSASEAMTSVMIFINKYYGFDGAGIQIISEEDEIES